MRNCSPVEMFLRRVSVRGINHNHNGILTHRNLPIGTEVDESVPFEVLGSVRMRFHLITGCDEGDDGDEARQLICTG